MHAELKKIVNILPISQWRRLNEDAGSRLHVSYSTTRCFSRAHSKSKVTFSETFFSAVSARIFFLVAPGSSRTRPHEL